MQPSVIIVVGYWPLLNNVVKDEQCKIFFSLRLRIRQMEISRREICGIRMLLLLLIVLWANRLFTLGLDGNMHSILVLACSANDKIDMFFLLWILKYQYVIVFSRLGLTRTWWERMLGKSNDLRFFCVWKKGMKNQCLFPFKVIAENGVRRVGETVDNRRLPGPILWLRHLCFSFILKKYEVYSMYSRAFSNTTLFYRTEILKNHYMIIVMILEEVWYWQRCSCSFLVI